MSFLITLTDTPLVNRGGQRDVKEENSLCFNNIYVFYMIHCITDFSRKVNDTL